MKRVLLHLFIFFDLSFFAQEVKTTDTSFTNTGKEMVKSVTYKTNGIRDSLVYLYGTKGHTVFIPKGDAGRGTWKIYWPDGILSYEYIVNENKKNGPFTQYYRNGQISGKQFYLDGKLNGNSTQYFKNGNLRTQGNFSDGKIDGSFKQYYPSGKLQWKGDYRDGRMSGERIYYNEDGEAINGSFVIKDDSGRVEREGKCINGKPEGEIKIYANGKLLILSNFKDGKPDGATFHYGKDAKLMSTEIYRNGVFKKGAKIEAEN